ncbi:Bug family tripartite tricarboxylate transporter substrate binding protein [Falsiroseomonas sp.]|jgi:tripartite-type tricarboxylate transporter receptor subunit TctC|uniref:Bug family tripartite tricarboxylate transporter substrate binding protein n=1 Tax=Falsiroseomonas sp. TaxID=2870721 RepID=UPI003F6FB82D
MMRKLLALLLLLLPALPAAAQDWQPTRPIRIVVPFPPGGISDSLARLFADRTGARLGQPLVVENRSGANGAVAGEFISRAQGDGYSYIMLSPSHLMVLPVLMRLSYDPMADLVPAVNLAANPFFLGVPGNSPFRNLADFIAAAKARPGALDYASGGAGSGTHLVMIFLSLRAGLDMQHIPYRGGAPAVQDLLAGRIAGYFGNPSDMAPFLQSGEVRVIASSGGARSALAPDVLTVAEQGFPGFRFETWNGLLAPRGTPPAAIARLAAAVREACAEEPVRAGLRRLGSDPVCNTTAEFAAQMQAEAPVWRDVVQRSGVRLD